MLKGFAPHPCVPEVNDKPSVNVSHHDFGETKPGVPCGVCITGVQPERLTGTIRPVLFPESVGS